MSTFNPQSGNSQFGNIPFHKPPLFLEETLFALNETLTSGLTQAGGRNTRYCEKWLSEYFNKPILLTSSCTHALEMIALLLDIKPGEEVILPSFTFSSVANAFLLRGASLRFCDVDKFGNLELNSIK